MAGINPVLIEHPKMRLRHLQRMEVKRGDSLPIDLQFWLDGEQQNLSVTNSETIKVGIKSKTAIGGNYLAYTNVFTKSGTLPTYAFTLILNTTDLNALLTSSTEYVEAFFEIAWSTGSGELSSISVPIRIYNDLNKGGESPSQYVGVEDGLATMVSGQSYVDVTFVTARSNATYKHVIANVENTVDGTPLNIIAGTITNKTTTGFRQHFSGAPNTGNYKYRWQVAD